jgi:hypothetical protein
LHAALIFHTTVEEVDRHLEPPGLRLQSGDFVVLPRAGLQFGIGSQRGPHLRDHAIQSCLRVFHFAFFGLLSLGNDPHSLRPGQQLLAGLQLIAGFANSRIRLHLGFDLGLRGLEGLAIERLLLRLDWAAR